MQKAKNDLGSEGISGGLRAKDLMLPFLVPNAPPVFPIIAVDSAVKARINEAKRAEAEADLNSKAAGISNIINIYNGDGDAEKKSAAVVKVIKSSFNDNQINLLVNSLGENQVKRSLKGGADSVNDNGSSLVEGLKTLIEHLDNQFKWQHAMLEKFAANGGQPEIAKSLSEVPTESAAPKKNESNP